MSVVAGHGHPRRRQLGELLRSRRERLQPEDVALPPGPRRRVRGLRREEVAQLAAISPTYYALLEQGREVHPSPQVLDALARALRLSAAERTHLHELAHDVVPRDTPACAEILALAVADLVDLLDPHPTYVTGRCWDVLAANRAARALWTDWPALPPAERNMLVWTFGNPAAREVFVDWEPEARALLARFRFAAARYPDDPQFQDLIDRLHALSHEVREWWPAHEVAPLTSGTKRLRHPTLGELELEHVVLQVADEPEQKLVTFKPSARDRSRIAALLDPAPDSRRAS
jgi:transcriptional regulator with XRE-family HTH domain